MRQTVALSDPRFDYDVAMRLRSATVFGIVVSLLGGVSLGVATFWSTTYYQRDARYERLLVAASREIRENYIEEIADEELVDHAIRGMVESLDDQSAFLDDDDLVALEEQTSGRFGGIGIEIGMQEGHITVVSPMGDMPAARVGILAGDRLMEVDHQPLKRRTLSEAVEGLRGEPGTDVHLRIRRDTSRDPLDFDITRASIPTVSGRMVSTRVGYVRIYQFDRPTHRDLEDVLAKLQHDGPLAGLILDLRDNPGGLLESAVDVADAFLTDGLIVTTDGRPPRSQQSFHASADDIAGGAPMTVLINGRSASASEVVAGALQDRGRATIVGSKSFGKGSVQSVMRLGSRAIKLTTARYMTPSGRSIQSEGVIPDVVLPRAEGETRPEYDQRLVDAALAEFGKTTTG